MRVPVERSVLLTRRARPSPAAKSASPVRRIRQLRIAQSSKESESVLADSCHNTTIERQAFRIERLERELSQLRQLFAEQQSALVDLKPQGQGRILKRTSSFGFDPRFHSTGRGVSAEDYKVLPPRIILVRHAESAGNVDANTYKALPDNQVPLTPEGHRQAQFAGDKIKAIVEAGGDPDYKVFFFISPYKRSQQTFNEISAAFSPRHMKGVRQEVQLREQDFGNFQDPSRIRNDLQERNLFGRFWYRFPNGESGADVYDRITIFEDHLVRDMNAGLFSGRTSVVLVTHGLALRVMLMRWFHWSVDEFLEVYNPPNAEPLVLEKMSWEEVMETGGLMRHTKQLYRLAPGYLHLVKGCTPRMCESLDLANFHDDVLERCSALCGNAAEDSQWTGGAAAAAAAAAANAVGSSGTVGCNGLGNFSGPQQMGA